MESQDEYYNANELSEDEEDTDRSEAQMVQEEPRVEEEEKENPQTAELSSELRKFQMNFYEEISQNSKAGKGKREGGYFDFVFSLCRKWVSKDFKWNPEHRASLIAELETFILSFKGRENPEDEALGLTISNINNLKNELFKQTINTDVARNIYVIDRILELLNRAKQWKNDPKSFNLKDLYERDVQASLKEFEVSVNSLFRSTTEDKLDRCASLMAELDKLRISPYWEESIYRYRLMYKELMWIKQQSYPIFFQFYKSMNMFEQAVEACGALAGEKVSGLSTIEDGVANGGYFDRRINEIYEAIKLQSCRLGSEALLYKGLCIIIKNIRKIFNLGLQKETIILCIDQLYEPVHKKYKEYFFQIQNSSYN